MTYDAYIIAAVKQIRLELTDEQANEVLKYIDRKFDDGLNEENVDLAMDWLYGDDDEEAA
jgi:hypothetical protein